VTGISVKRREERHVFARRTRGGFTMSDGQRIIGRSFAAMGEELAQCGRSKLRISKSDAGNAKRGFVVGEEETKPGFAQINIKQAWEG